jgi:hypothetical protein
MEYIVSVRYISGYCVELTFSNGVTGIVDLSGELYGRLFEPLKDINEFRKVRVEPDLSTIVWPNGADLTPDHLYDLVLQSKEREFQEIH